VVYNKLSQLLIVTMSELFEEFSIGLPGIS